MTRRPQSSAELIRLYIVARWPVMLALLVVLLGASGMQVAMPRLLGLFVDKALAGGAVSYLISLAFWYFALALANQLLSLGASYLGQNLSWTSTNAMRDDLFGHCVHLGLPFHNRHTPGELIQRIDGDVGSMSNFLSQFSVRILGNLFLAAGVLCMLFREDWRAGLALLVFLVVSLVVLRVTRNMAVPARRESSETVAQLLGYVEERLGGLHDIRPNGAAQYVMNGLYLLGRRRYKTLQTEYVVSSLRWAVGMSTFLAGNLSALGIGAWLFLSGRATVGTVYMLFSYTNLLIAPLWEITSQMQDLEKALAGMSRALELFRLEPEPSGGASLPSGPLPLELRGITFSYEKDVPALDQVSFRLEPGKTLGVVGRTGSGKSTLARLLLRFYDPSAGQILVGGRDTREVALGELRGRVALVTQEVQLFKGTVRDNVTVFDPGVSDDRTSRAMEEVGMGEWLRAQPQGLETRLGSGGTGVSAGEAQLFALARAFLRDPGLVILDEASSRLDPATERLVDEAVRRLLRGRTAVVIAHRLSTLSRADFVLVLESGQTIEFGDRERLESDPDSRFARLLRSGMGEFLA